MALKLSEQLFITLADVRFEPVLKRVRVLAGDSLVADTTDAVLVWEPRRVVPSYAVPVRDLRLELVQPTTDATAPMRPVTGLGGSVQVLDPRTGFAAHTAEGEPLSVRISDAAVAELAAFRPADPALNGFVVLDFAAFDWVEEDEPIVGHPRDPFHRIDVLRSSRRVTVEHRGRVLAETTRAHFLFEGTFPMVRYYLPPADVSVELERSDHQTTCAYKGHATHWSVPGDDDLRDIAWTYESPLDDAIPVAGLVSFYTERLDLSIDGTRLERPQTPWSRRD
jgi:uncharacterized protein (DUF427 family)